MFTIYNAKTKKGQETQNKILNSAKKIFAEKDFYNTSIADITREAGVGMGTFYLYFSSKKDIFRTLVLHLSKQLRQQISEKVQNVDTRLEAERIGLRTFFDYITHEPELYKIVFQSQFVDPELFREYYQSFGDAYTKRLREAIGNGEIKDLDPEVISYCIMGISNFVGLRWIIWQNDSIPEDVFEQMMEFIENGIKQG